jgi:hypothetical protein
MLDGVWVITRMFLMVTGVSLLVVLGLILWFGLVQAVVRYLGELYERANPHR